MHRKTFLALMAASSIAALTTQAYARDAALQMVVIDVEGGGGTLFVTPEGKSLLIDTGNPEESRVTGAHPSSERIAAAAQALGVRKIDYLITTHYHGDHVGGLAGLLARMPVGVFIDHGENREVPGTQGPGGPIPMDQVVDGHPHNGTALGYEHYLKEIAGKPHRVVKAGETLSIGSMKLTFVSSDAQMIAKPLSGAGEANPSCEGMAHMESNGGEENTRSVGTIIRYGKTTVAALGDLTWDREKDLFCPIDRVGPVSVFLASHHGTQWSNSPAALNALKPVVTIMGNSPVKGDDPERVRTIQASPRFQALWRLHGSKAHPEIDGSADMIANPDPDAAKDKFYNLRLRLQKDGDVTVINERTGFNKTYKAGG